MRQERADTMKFSLQLWVRNKPPSLVIYVSLTSYVQVAFGDLMQRDSNLIDLRITLALSVCT